jgi:putative ubiquitin-RnfH superfamily antitoxin RatB of RatAB toxin-antitoxin module
VTAPAAGPICVEVVYAQPQRSIAKTLSLPQGATVAEALAAAAAHPDFSGMDLENSPVGIFGKPAHRGWKLGDGDRVEIYRPLLEEPKLARRNRASRKASKPFRS